jgi:hypothetical protein
MTNYKPTIDELREQGLLFYEVVGGSQSHGTNTPESDIDLRGYYHVPIEYRSGLGSVENQSMDSSHDIEYYNMKRAFELLMKANPNQIELLWIPEDCIQIYKKAIMDDLFDNRDLFISKVAYTSHFQYAKSQIGKAKGRNKWVNNPKPKRRPTKLDFCRYIDLKDFGADCEAAGTGVGWPKEKMPFRPQKAVSDNLALDLSKFNVAKMERMENTYRLYYYGDKARGVFRGPNEQLVCESIPMEEEWPYFYGVLIYNEQEYDRACSDWKDYWNWIDNRNESRWLQQEKGLIDYDAKNMSHCVRLMLSSRSILTEGRPIVRFEGDQLDLLKRIKKGELEYSEIMEMVNSLQAELETLVEKTKIPDEVDYLKLDKLYRHLNQVAEKELVG